MPEKGMRKLEARLHDLLNPRRFPGMSKKMCAIVVYVLDKRWTEP